MSTAGIAVGEGMPKGSWYLYNSRVSTWNSSYWISIGSFTFYSRWGMPPPALWGHFSLRKKNFQTAAKLTVTLLRCTKRTDCIPALVISFFVKLEQASGPVTKQAVMKKIWLVVLSRKDTLLQWNESFASEIRFHIFYSNFCKAYFKRN